MDGSDQMIIILPIRLDGVGFLLRHEKVFQTPNMLACNSILYSISANSPSKQQGGRHNRRPGSDILFAKGDTIQYISVKAKGTIQVTHPPTSMLAYRVEG